MSDESLMIQYKNGNVEAFNKLYEKYGPVVYGFVRKRLRDSEVDDFYQKVWRRLHEKRYLYTDQPFAPWFFVLMKHLLVDEYRSLARKSSHESQEELIEKIYGKVDDEHFLDEVLDKLPEDTRKLVKEYYLEGKTYEELEKETGLSQTGLRQRLSRAIRGLRYENK